MAGHASVLEDDSLLSRLDRALVRVELGMAFVSGVGAFGLMCLAVISVTGRNFFNEPLRGYVDWIEAAMPLIAIFGISYVQRVGGHIRMDIVVGALKGRLLWIAEFITTFFILVLMVLLVWGTWAHFGRSFDFGAPNWSRDSSIDIGLPIWPAKLIVPIAFAVICLRLVLQLWGYGRAIVLGLDTPAGVPLVQSVAEQAMAEADQVRGHDA
ncbi:TRAP transporter small permease subunit [Maliponia aquimaris]|uniref:TRAP transporter small permease protein n=1 Tax=Maliponia aquimaris TaxID=1673631 RepID=A0A238K3C7_9RHOB|nr:TRAP transporter small permease [Maliponia aquimaris]SMX36967.1 Tripartite ATP-independent periplasmic transporters, DctQ component [Maliponia aquimaris]